MNWLDKLERRFGRYAIRNLIFYIIGLNGLVFIFNLFIQPGSAVRALVLDPGLVMRGEIWRLITFVFIPPNFSILWVVFALYIFYLTGAGLESEWGTFKFNIYYLTGVIMTVIASLLTGGLATAYYINLSLFLAFAAVYPDYQFLLFFILPVKVKWLAWLDWAYLAFVVISSLLYQNYAAAALVIASVVNFFLFFGLDFFKKQKLRSGSYQRRKKFFDEIANTPPIHTCAVCGKTDKSDPRMEFKYCKVCGEDYVYCVDHIDDHQHLKH